MRYAFSSTYLNPHHNILAIQLRERIMAQRENILNRRLGLLTILSAIFMPLTLLSGKLDSRDMIGFSQHHQLTRDLMIARYLGYEL